MTIFALLFTLAAIGMSESAYLIRTRMANAHPACPIGGSCEIVLKSKYNHLFGFVHNDIAGFLFYVIVTIVNGLLVIGVGPMNLWFQSLCILMILGSLMSLLLVFIQWKILKAWCFWCLLSAITVWLMGILLLLHLYIPSFLSPSPL